MAERTVEEEIAYRRAFPRERPANIETPGPGSGVGVGLPAPASRRACIAIAGALSSRA